MICIKTNVDEMPEWCDDCHWMGSAPHPRKGWTVWCELCHESMDDDAKDGWCYDGNGRPENCPLVEVS